MIRDALATFASHITTPLCQGGAICISSLVGSADAFAAISIATMQGDPKLVLAVTPGIPDADRLADDLRVIAKDENFSTNVSPRILEYPPPAADDKSAFGLRLKTATAIRAWIMNPYPCIVVAPYQSLSAKVPYGCVKSLSLEMGRTDFTTTTKHLAELGYDRVATVDREGSFSIRGGIVDAWSPGDEFPVRAEFFGADLESLRIFDPATQISVERISSANLLPAKDAEENPPMRTTIMDLLPNGATILAIEHNDYGTGVFSEAAKRVSIVYTGDPAPQGIPSGDFTTVALPGFAELGANEAHHPELFDAARNRLERHIFTAESHGEMILKADDLSGGFEIPSGNGRNGLLVVTKADRVFSKRKISRQAGSPSSAGARLNDFDSLEPGELVVHVDHGIGRYIGSSEISVDGRFREVFTIEYANGAKLHVPATHAHLLSRYVGVKGTEAKLHRLDGRRWMKDCIGAQKAVADLASALLETQAKRDTTPGFRYDVECDGLNAFEASFPYEETPDQATAIAALKKDMATSKPMDRLICGDAGYGKTEVAMRAAYIAAMNGKQVALLAPTTVLAEQHFETFTSRFDGTPVRIESVSRFQSSSVQAGTFQRLATGVCDIVIGTHSILSDKISFKDLGLIIIDEEQRFGVKHKEFLKRLRATADVLTLSATPIPRTLYLSMTGARDLSLLRSPPRERVAVDTKVVTYSDEIVSDAIRAELARGGQAFFLHNRVSTIGKVEKRLKAIVPEARVVVAHGQMDNRALARKMRDFERGDFDVLLSTTIVESGIDIPRANTILVDHAETFGLADLYQLRGRVGRSSRQGRAIFLLPTGGLVDSDARERLSALKRHGGLGAGFNLAVRDLELRGAGNLLGSQQSGHIASIGFTLYCQLLSRTIAKMKGEKQKDVVDVKLNLDFIDLSPSSSNEESAAALPYSYMEEDVQRMNFMKRLAEASSTKDIKAVTAEMADRFGAPPITARRLIRLAELRIKCATAGIRIIDTKDSRAVFYKNGSRSVAKVVDLKSRTADGKIKELLSALR